MARVCNPILVHHSQALVDSIVVGHTIKRCTQPAAEENGGFEADKENNNSFGKQPDTEGFADPPASSAVGGWDAPTAVPAAAGW